MNNATSSSIKFNCSKIQTIQQAEKCIPGLSNSADCIKRQQKPTRIGEIRDRKRSAEVREYASESTRAIAYANADRIEDNNHEAGNDDDEIDDKGIVDDELDERTNNKYANDEANEDSVRDKTLSDKNLARDSRLATAAQATAITFKVDDHSKQSARAQSFAGALDILGNVDNEDDSDASK